mmetsp:Transcript_15425/g.20879  ORF Transcript_15425/g.20879 Transcript_15425/m.20879 type:complete len:126 (-) Transcript_15425:1356-1733(-)
MNPMFLPFEAYGKQQLVDQNQDLQTKGGGVTGEPATFNDHMNNMHFRANMHDMRDLMKSLAHESETMLNASRSNFVFNRSVYHYGDPYNQFGSSSNFRGNVLGSASNIANPHLNANASGSMLQFS